MPDSTEPRITFLLATFNRASFLRAALTRLRALKTERDELIVIDGGSRDATPQVAAEFSDVITTFISEPDRGEADAFNKGLRLARGRYIKFITDDDELLPEAFAAAVAILEANPEIDALLCGGESYAADPNSGPPRFLRSISLPRDVRLRGNLWAVLFQCNCGVGLFIARSAAEKIGLLDLRFKAVDADYLARLIGSGLDVRYAHLCLYRHIEYPHSGQRQTRRMIGDVLRVLFRAGRVDLIAYWVASSVVRRLRGQAATESTYRGGDADWDGHLQS